MTLNHLGLIQLKYYFQLKYYSYHPMATRTNLSATSKSSSLSSPASIQRRPRFQSFLTRPSTRPSIRRRSRRWPRTTSLITSQFSRSRPTSCRRPCPSPTRSRPSASSRPHAPAVVETDSSSCFLIRPDTAATELHCRCST